MSVRGSGYGCDSTAPTWFTKGRKITLIVWKAESISLHDNFFCLLVNLVSVLELVMLLQLFLNE